jgi:hypothetical protein
MLDFCPLPSDDDVAGSIVGQNVEAFTRLIGEAARLMSERRFEQAVGELLLARRRAARAASHKGVHVGATPSAEIMDREPDQASGAASKADGARKGLGCESSAIRQQDASRRAS